MSNFEQLLKLMKDNPGLPVVPLVNSEIVAEDGYAHWLGSWGPAYLENYYRGEERYYFYDEDDMEDLLAEVMGWDWYDAASEDEVLATYQALPWVECIVVYIDLPEE